MASTIYTRFRELINDSTATYSVSDNQVWMYLDRAIEALSKVAGEIYQEDVTISSGDISAGYVSLTKDPIFFIEEYFGVEHVDWEFKDYNKVRFIDPTVWTANTIEGVRYKRCFARFKGSTKEDAALDHPEQANWGILLYAVSEYLVKQGIMTVDGESSLVQSKSEEGMSISYAVSGELASYSTPGAMKTQALDIFYNLPNAEDKFFTVKL